MTPGSLTYRIGDATSPERDGRPVIIAHVVNDAGRWGAGFSGSLGWRYPAVEVAYRRWAAAHRGVLPLGVVHAVEVQPASAERPSFTVVHMVAQHGIRGKAGAGRAPIRYAALASALSHVAARALLHRAVVVMPRIGCGLAGGEWSEVEPLIRKHLCTADGIDVVVYDLNERDAARYAA